MRDRSRRRILALHPQTLQIHHAILHRRSNPTLGPYQNAALCGVLIAEDVLNTGSYLGTSVIGFLFLLVELVMAMVLAMNPAVVASLSKLLLRSF